MTTLKRLYELIWWEIEFCMNYRYFSYNTEVEVHTQCTGESFVRFVLIIYNNDRADIQWFN